MTGYQAHSLHLSDAVGTFNERCPDCNNSYYQAVEAVLALHSPAPETPSRPWVSCAGCTNGSNWPCPTVRAVRDAGAPVPGIPQTPAPASEAGLKRCQTRRYPSGNERCGLFLIGGLCVHHGRETGI